MMSDDNFIINIYINIYFMFENVDRVHGRFLRYAILKFVVGRLGDATVT